MRAPDARATVRRLRAADAKVGIIDLNPPSDDELAELGEGVVFAKADITDEAAVNHALDVSRAAPRVAPACMRSLSLMLRM